jgi:hypothetical protein
MVLFKFLINAVLYAIAPPVGILVGLTWMPGHTIAALCSHEEGCTISPYKLEKDILISQLIQLLERKHYIWLSRPLESLSTKNHHGLLMIDRGYPRVLEFNSDDKKCDAIARFVTLESFIGVASSVRVYDHYDKDIDILESYNENCRSYVKGSYHETKHNCETFIHSLLGITKVWSQGDECEKFMMLGTVDISTLEFIDEVKKLQPIYTSTKFMILQQTVRRPRHRRRPDRY